MSKTQPKTPASPYCILRHVGSGLYFARGDGYTATRQEASVFGTARAAMVAANSPKGSVETIPVAGRPMLS